MQEYGWPDEIPDEAIKKAFAEADVIKFSARPFNRVKYRAIAFGDLGWWLPLARVLPLIDITPEMLKPVFNLSLEVVETYEQLGSFPLNGGAFCELAKVLGKSIEVWREDGGTGDHYHLFTALPSGKIIQPTT
jgi:hypothetical protein